MTKTQDPKQKLKPQPRETDPHLRKVGRRNRASIRKTVPKEVADLIAQTLNAGIVGKGIKEGDTLKDVIDRYVPEIYDLAELHGVRFIVDLDENSHRNLCQGKVFYRLEQMTRH